MGDLCHAMSTRNIKEMSVLGANTKPFDSLAGGQQGIQETQEYTRYIQTQDTNIYESKLVILFYTMLYVHFDWGEPR